MQRPCGRGGKKEVAPLAITIHFISLGCAKNLVNTEQIMALHVDQTSDRVVPFPDIVAERIAQIDTQRPDWVGRSIG